MLDLALAGLTSRLTKCGVIECSILILLVDLLQLVEHGSSIGEYASLVPGPFPAFQCCTPVFKRATLKSWEWAWGRGYEYA